MGDEVDATEVKCAGTWQTEVADIWLDVAPCASLAKDLHPCALGDFCPALDTPRAVAGEAMITEVIEGDGARAARAALFGWAIGGWVLQAERQCDAEPAEQARAKCCRREDERGGCWQG